MPSQAQQSSSELARQDMAEPACEGEAESAKAEQLTMCHTPTLGTYPSFVQAVREYIRTRSRRFQLEVPAPFVKEHGHSFQATVALQGPSGRLTPVRLRIRSSAIRDRVQFAGVEWKAFVLDNELQVGQQLRFSLVAKSTFEVRQLDSSTAPSVRKSRKEPSLDLPQNVLENLSTKLPSGEVFAMTSMNDVVYANFGVTSRVKEEVDSLVGNLQCPHFVTKIGKSNLLEYRSSSLSVPYKFFEKYGEYFSETTNFFQGPSGSLMEMCFSVGQIKFRFTKGWKAFRKDNNIQLGDVLLFSLRAPASWLVQVVKAIPESSKSEKSYVTEPASKLIDHLDPICGGS